MTIGDLTGLRQRVATLVAEHQVPGVAIGVCDPDSVVWSGGFGSDAVSAETMFGVQSCSKMYVATAVLIAVQARLVELDVPITRYLPEFRVNSSFEDRPERLITLRHLLSHTAGFTHEAPVGSNYWSAGNPSRRTARASPTRGCVSRSVTIPVLEPRHRPGGLHPAAPQRPAVPRVRTPGPARASRDDANDVQLAGDRADFGSGDRSLGGHHPAPGAGPDGCRRRPVHDGQRRLPLCAVPPRRRRVTARSRTARGDVPDARGATARSGIRPRPRRGPRRRDSGPRSRRRRFRIPVRHLLGAPGRARGRRTDELDKPPAAMAIGQRHLPRPIPSRPPRSTPTPKPVKVSAKTLAGMAGDYTGRSEDTSTFTADGVLIRGESRHAVEFIGPYEFRVGEEQFRFRDPDAAGRPAYLECITDGFVRYRNDVPASEPAEPDGPWNRDYAIRASGVPDGTARLRKEKDLLSSTTGPAEPSASTNTPPACTRQQPAKPSTSPEPHRPTPTCGSTERCLASVEELGCEWVVMEGAGQLGVKVVQQRW